MERYENRVASVDAELLKEDEYTFSVLKKILKRVCTLTITDHESYIICYSCPPYPVWVWLKEGTSEEKMERIWEILKKEFPPQSDFCYNTKYFFAQYIMEREADMAIRLHLFAYDCPAAIEPKKRPAGCCVQGEEKDLEDIYAFIKAFHSETGVDEKTQEQYRREAEALLERGLCYVWKNENGENVALCSYNINENKGSVSHVYTRKDARRQGYAANLVYQVTRMLQEKGWIPVLYTDGEYAASNACYEGIGYRLKGKLCMIGRKK